MKKLNERLSLLRKSLQNRSARVMIIGLGSVGGYLLDYLLSTKDENLKIYVVGRDKNKMQSDVNINVIASCIRRQNSSKVTIIDGVNLNDIAKITETLKSVRPDIIVNASRAYPGLKYGSISWPKLRAYGIWTPLSIKFTKNIMEAVEDSQSDAIVINTSYSDAVIPWLKSAGKAYPDFGSGNVNHLLPRIKLAVAELENIADFWNIDITFAVAHFHDVCISKEGQTEGVDMLIDIHYNGNKLNPDMNKVFELCSIPMPVDAKRNMMNASSNFEIIESILDVCRNGGKRKLHSPGFDGNIGGYPVMVDGSATDVKVYVDETYFSLEKMISKNRESIYLDGVENVCDGTLFYTDELIAKVKIAFGVDLMKSVKFDEISKAAAFIIDRIITPQINMDK